MYYLTHLIVFPYLEIRLIVNGNCTFSIAKLGLFYSIRITSPLMVAAPGVDNRKPDIGYVHIYSMFSREDSADDRAKTHVMGGKKSLHVFFMYAVEMMRM